MYITCLVKLCQSATNSKQEQVIRIQNNIFRERNVIAVKYLMPCFLSFERLELSQILAPNVLVFTRYILELLHKDTSSWSLYKKKHHAIVLLYSK